jgi:hypothetical protein
MLPTFPEWSALAALRPLQTSACAVSPSFRDEFHENALAPAATGMIQPFGDARKNLVDDWREFRPKGESSDDTSFHQAIRAAESLFEEGRFPAARRLLIELLCDLDEVQDARPEASQEKWSARYPSRLGFAPKGADLEGFRAQIEALLNAHYDSSGWARDAFEQWLLNTGAQMREAVHARGYDSIEDMMADIRDAEGIETVFDVIVSEPLQHFLGSSTRIGVRVRGVPSVGQLLVAIKEQYPILRGTWALHVDPDVKGVHDIVLPGHRLILVDRAKVRKGIWSLGPKNQSVWSTLLLLLSLSHSWPPLACIVAGALAVGLFGIGVQSDAELRVQVYPVDLLARRFRQFA